MTNAILYQGTVLSILNKIANTDSTKQKEEILKSHDRDEVLKRVYRMTYSPRLQYGIKKIPEFDKATVVLFTLTEALDFLEFHLATRKCTGNNAIERVAQILSGLSEDDANVIQRIISRDLECGASSTIANKVWKDLIPKQPQMLASSYSEKALESIEWPAYAQLKADGARCFAEIRGTSREDVKLLSRAGNEYLRLDDLKDELIEMYKTFESFYPAGIMIDGELVYVSETKKTDGLDFLFGDGTQTDSVVLRSESNGIANKSLKNTITEKESKQMSFQVWDFVPLDVVYNDEKSARYYDRFTDLKTLTKKSERLILIENTLVNNLAEAKEIYKKYVEQGLEGIILKNTSALWENKRSKNLVKFKEEIAIDLRVVGIIPHKKDPNKLGAIVCESDDGLIKVKCGSGFTDTDRIKVKGIWNDIPINERDDLNRSKLMENQSLILGKIVELKCNGWIAAEDRTDSVSLFLPVMNCIRTDKLDTNALKDVFPDALSVLK